MGNTSISAHCSYRGASTDERKHIHIHTQLLESELDEAYQTYEAQSIELAGMRKTCSELAQQRTHVETQRAGTLKVWESTSSLHYKLLAT